MSENDVCVCGKPFNDFKGYNADIRRDVCIKCYKEYLTTIEEKQWMERRRKKYT
jgi:hypothetical protein